jgi:hypothetical protein
MHDLTLGGAPERGQVLVIFALGIVAIIGMTGLVIDGGATYVQRREQQNVVDAAAMAAAYAYLNSNGDATLAVAMAQKVARADGYAPEDPGGGVNVSVSSHGPGGATVSVGLTKPHRNYFSGLLGFTTWDVSTTATAQAGAPNGALGVMPLIFNKRVWNAASQDPDHPIDFNEPGTGTEDVPQTATQFNWTVFCTANGNPCNGNSDDIDQIIKDNGRDQVVTLDMLIGPLDAGAHTTLFSDLADHVGNAYPVAIVADDGAMLGWAYFHVTGSVGGSTKQVSWFEKFSRPPLVIIERQDRLSAFGGYVVELTD